MLAHQLDEEDKAYEEEHRNWPGEGNIDANLDEPVATSSHVSTTFTFGVIIDASMITIWFIRNLGNFQNPNHLIGEL